MKNKALRWLSLGLAALVMLGTAGCGKSGGGTSGGKNGKKAFEEYIKDEKAVDLKGYKFKIVDFNTDVWKPDTVDDTRKQLSIDILEDVEKKFNCTIEVESVDAKSLFSKAQPAIMSGNKFADLIGTTEWAYGQLLGGNLLADLSKIETLDLKQDYFNQQIVNLTTINGGTYAFSADFDAHLYTQMIVYYNSVIWEELGLPNPYQLVRDGEWTWDKLLEYAHNATRDYDGNGIIDSESDRWGVVAGSGDLMSAMFAGMDGKFYDVDENGNIYLSCLDAQSAEKLTFITKFFQNENVLYKRENQGVMDMFTQGKSLFMCRINTNREELKDMENDFGILPLPKWNKEQETYKSYINHNTKIYSIPNTNENTYEAGIIITALARRYQAYTDLGLEEFEDVLYRFDDDSEMLRKYINAEKKYELLDILRGVNSTILKPYSVMIDACVNNKFSDVVSGISSYKDAIGIALQEFKDNLSK